MKIWQIIEDVGHMKFKVEEVGVVLLIFALILNFIVFPNDVLLNRKS